MLAGCNIFDYIFIHCNFWREVDSLINPLSSAPVCSCVVLYCRSKCYKNLDAQRNISDPRQCYITPSFIHHYYDIQNSYFWFYLILNILNHFKYQLIPLMSLRVPYNSLVHRLKYSSSVSRQKHEFNKFQMQ